MQSITPRQIVPSFHRKSHFKALQSVFLKQGQAGQIVNSGDDSGSGQVDVGESQFIEKLILAMDKNKKNFNQTSVSPINGLSKSGSQFSAFVHQNLENTTFLKNESS